ncbi:Far upstream element-binding protein 3, partial [Ananas comosus]
DQEVEKSEGPPAVNGQYPLPDNLQPEEDLPKSTTEASGQDGDSSGGQLDSDDLSLQTSSRKIEVPNNKVGVLIGKAGETIKFLQINSGAKIQITRDAQADPQSSTRPVELIGSLESINKAEKLIRDVIAEADAGGSPALVAKGFGTVQSGAEQIEIQVPNEKVGLVIGKGGETIKNLQTRSGARIQLIPQHLPEGDSSKERTVRVTGDKKQIEVAKEMIKEVISQIQLRLLIGSTFSVPYSHLQKRGIRLYLLRVDTPSRLSSLSGGHGQQSYRPRGPSTAASHWGPRLQQPTAGGYDYPQRGMYPPQNAQQYPQSYGSSYSQQPPRTGMSTSWDPRGPGGHPSQSGGYDYYRQGSQPYDARSSGTGPAPGSAPVNYNYAGQSQASGYGQPNPYPQSAPSTQQAYGHGYGEPKYDAHTAGQQMYGGHQQPPMGSQPGYPQQQQQDPYGKPPYGGAQQSYGPPQAPAPSYGSGAPAPQSYPYGSTVPSQPNPNYAQPYGPPSGTADGYAQSYPQQSGQYGQGYPQQGAQQYGQYPQAQPGYADQSVANNANYGYQGGAAAADAGYGNSMPSSGYGAPAPAGGGYGGQAQAGYVQPPPNQSGYEQSVPPSAAQPGYGVHPGGAQAGYAKGPSPQPGYGGQWQV